MPIDTRDLERALEDYAVLAVESMANEFMVRAKMRVPRASGQLWNSIDFWYGTINGNAATAQVFAEAEHASYQDEGTGIYGPTGERIYPTNSNVLAFYWPPAGGTVFFKSVAGTPATNFWSDVVDDFDSWVGDVDLPNA